MIYIGGQLEGISDDAPTPTSPSWLTGLKTGLASNAGTYSLAPLDLAKADPHTLRDLNRFLQEQGTLKITIADKGSEGGPKTFEGTVRELALQEKGILAYLSINDGETQLSLRRKNDNHQCITISKPRSSRQAAAATTELARGLGTELAATETINLPIEVDLTNSPNGVLVTRKLVEETIRAADWSTILEQARAEDKFIMIQASKNEKMENPILIDPSEVERAEYDVATSPAMPYLRFHKKPGATTSTTSIKLADLAGSKLKISLINRAEYKGLERAQAMGRVKRVLGTNELRIDFRNSQNNDLSNCVKNSNLWAALNQTGIRIHLTNSQNDHHANSFRLPGMNGPSCNLDKSLEVNGDLVIKPGRHKIGSISFENRDLTLAKFMGKADPPFITGSYLKSTDVRNHDFYSTSCFVIKDDQGQDLVVLPRFMTSNNLSLWLEPVYDDAA
jgi:hypothetical protein